MEDENEARGSASRNLSYHQDIPYWAEVASPESPHSLSESFSKRSLRRYSGMFIHRFSFNGMGPAEPAGQTCHVQCDLLRTWANANMFFRIHKGTICFWNPAIAQPR
jgi:hypothetical protein